MKLSPVAILFGAAVAFFPGASAATTTTTSLRGNTPDEESFTDIINCPITATCSNYRFRTCNEIDDQCQGLCVWVGTKQGGSCKDRGSSNRSCRSYSRSNTCKNAGCDWINGACRNPSSSFKCSDYDGTNQRKCVNKGCFWNSNNLRCNSSSNIITRSCRSILTGNDCFSSGCDWINGVCRNPSSSFKCSDYDGRRSTCVNKGCFWNSSNLTCNSTNNNRVVPNANTCTGPNDRFEECDFMTEFCYTKGNCSVNARGVCEVKPKNYADCASSGLFSTYPTSSGTACNSNHFYASECEAAQSGKNIAFTNKDAASDEYEHEEYLSEYEEEE